VLHIVLAVYSGVGSVVGVGVGVGSGVGEGIGSGVGTGVSAGVGCGAGVEGCEGVGCGVCTGVGRGVVVGVDSGVGSGVGVGRGGGDNDGIGVGNGVRICADGVGRGLSGVSSATMGSASVTDSCVGKSASRASTCGACCISAFHSSQPATWNDTMQNNSITTAILFFIALASHRVSIIQLYAYLWEKQLCDYSLTHTIFPVFVYTATLLHRL